MNHTTKEHPLILNAQEVNAVLAGNKTQHRVPIKMRYGSPDFLGSRDCNKSDPSLWGWDNFEDSEIRVLSNEPCPFGAIGDRLWVQEPTLAIEDVGWIGPVFVASDDGRNAIDWGYGPYDDPAHIPACELTYNNPCDLSYENSRLLLEITDIRIERVQDISEDDAIAEGVKPIHKNPVDSVGPNHFTISNGGYRCSKPKASDVFKEMYKVSDDYDKHGENPWVWVIDFKVVEPSEVKL